VRRREQPVQDRVRVRLLPAHPEASTVPVCGAPESARGPWPCLYLHNARHAGTVLHMQTSDFPFGGSFVSSTARRAGLGAYTVTAPQRPIGTYTGAPLVRPLGSFVQSQARSAVPTIGAVRTATGSVRTSTGSVRTATGSFRTA
jgi:hypothetical protein